MADELYAHCVKTRDAVVATVEARFADGRDGEDAWGRGGVMHGRAMPSPQDVRWAGTRHIVT
jgi:hypothetical protein